MAQDRNAVDHDVEGFKAAYVETLGTGRFAPLSGHLADDVVVLMPGREPMDKEAFRSTVDEWAANTSTYTDATFTTEERTVTDDLVVERGIAHEEPVGGGDEAKVHDFNYLWCFRPHDSGWNVSHLMWNQIR